VDAFRSRSISPVTQVDRTSTALLLAPVDRDTASPSGFFVDRA
jgi:hypothetical protein